MQSGSNILYTVLSAFYEFICLMFFMLLCKILYKSQQEKVKDIRTILISFN